MKYTKYFFLCCLFCFLTSYAQDDVMTLRIMTYNIQHGAGRDDVIDLDRQAAVIRNADPEIIGLQEVDSCVKRSNRVHQAAVMANSLGMYSTFGPAIPLTGGKYGVAILSKEKPLSHRNIPLPGNEKRTLLVCEFEEYVFATTHLALEEENRLTSLEIILEEAARWDKPFFICGDLNDEPTTTLITQMKKKFSFLNYITNNSTNYTFPSGVPKKIIDYIASYGRVYKSIRKRQVLNEPDASDHRPVLVEIRMDRYTTPIISPTEENVQGFNSSWIQLDAVCDLSGRKINPSLIPHPSSLKKGLYIVNGKKLFIGN